MRKPKPKASLRPDYKEILKKNLIWKRSNSVEHTKSLRNARYKYRYGITLDDYERMFTEQGGVCKICRSSDTGRKQSAHFAVDHCHKTGKIRGLLCLKCNKGLSDFDENFEIFDAAIKYLKEHL